MISRMLVSSANIDDFRMIMRQYIAEGIISASVRQLTEQVILNQPDWPVAVFGFVGTAFPYAPDPEGYELLQHPNLVANEYLTMGRQRHFDCDDHAMLSASMLGSIGYAVRAAIIDTRMNGEFDHAIGQWYSEIFTDWVNLDASTHAFPLGYYIPHTKVLYV